MGYFSSSSTSQSTLAPLSEKGQSYDTLFVNLFTDILSEYGGSTVVPVEKTSYKDQAQADSIKQKIADLDNQIQGLVTPSSAPTRGGGVGRGNDQQSRGIDSGSLQRQRDSLQSQLDSLPKDSYFDFDLQKKEDPRVQAAIDRYGPDSPQVSQARLDVKQFDLDKLSANADLERNWLKGVNKFVSGDLSYTPEQANQVNNYIAPIKDVIVRTTNDLLDQYGQSDQALRSSLNDLSTQIDKSGYTIEDTLKAADLQYQQSGKVLLDVLKDVNTNSNAKAKFEFDLIAQQADQKAANQAALLGLPPGSQSEKIASMKLKTDALKSIELNLAEQESRDALNIQGTVEQGRTNIALSRIQLAQSQGAKKEAVAQQGFGLTKLLTDKREAASAGQANALIDLERKKQEQLFGVAYGNLPNQAQIGANALGFGLNLNQGKASQQLQLLNPLLQQLGVEQQKQVAEAKNVTTQSKSAFDNITGLIGAGASIAGAAFGIPSFGGLGGGGGGAKPVPNYFGSGLAGAGAFAA